MSSTRDASFFSPDLPAGLNLLARGLRAAAAFLAFLLSTSHLAERGLPVAAAATLGLLVGGSCWIGFRLARWLRWLTMRRKDHLLITPWRRFMLFGIEPAIASFFIGLALTSVFSDAMGSEPPSPMTEPRK